MVNKYEKTRRYNERDTLLISLEMQSEILQELKKLNKLIKQGETIKRLPPDKRINK